MMWDFWRSKRRVLGRSTLTAWCIVLIGSVALAGYRLQHDRSLWDADGAIYLRMTLEDAGIKPLDAEKTVDAFMLTTSEAQNAQSRSFYGSYPPAYYRDQFSLFRTRPLYPALAGALRPQFGFQSLKIVSACSYVAAIMLMFAILTTIASPWIAAIGAFSSL